MDRRSAIKRTTILMGAALSVSTVSGLMAGCKAQKQLNWQPLFLTEHEARTVTALADTILPETDTPSASQVGVPEYMDDVIGNFWSDAEQGNFRTRLKEVNDISNENFGSTYSLLEEEKQNEIMDQLVENAKNSSENDKPFFLQLKELVYSGYFTSEYIGENVLAYDPVPGEYKGDLPVSEVDKAWSL